MKDCFLISELVPYLVTFLNTLLLLMTIIDPDGLLNSQIIGSRFIFNTLDVVIIIQEI